MAFTENSSGKSRMRQARSDSSSHDSYVASNLITSAGAEKVTLRWGMEIPWTMHFLFFPPEA